MIAHIDVSVIFRFVIDRIFCQYSHIPSQVVFSFTIILIGVTLVAQHCLSEFQKLILWQWLRK